MAAMAKKWVRYREESQMMADLWNERYPEGTEVHFMAADGDFIAKTRSVAWMASDQPLVLLQGFTGGFSLRFIKPVGRDDPHFGRDQCECALSLEHKKNQQASKMLAGRGSDGG